MAETIKMTLDATQYILPTQDDIRSAKQYVLLRERYANLLQDKIDDILEDATERIITICYRWNVSPTDLQFSSDYNEKMMEEISEVMDEIEKEILDLIYDYSAKATDDKERISKLAAWMATLGRGNRNLRNTLDGYLYKYMKDMEAVVAACLYADVKMTDAITKAKTSLHSVYTMPEVRAAFKDASKFSATYIRNRGVQYGAVGISNNGSTNVTNMAKITLQMAWMREQLIEFKASGAVGYWQGRGATYNCDLCDSEVGLHIGEWDNAPYPHPHCMCWRIPIYSK